MCPIFYSHESQPLPKVREPHSGPIPSSFADQRKPALVPPTATRIAGYGTFLIGLGWFLTGLALSSGNSSVTLPPFPTPAQAANLTAACLATVVFALSAGAAVVHWVRYPSLLRRYQTAFREWDAAQVAKEQARYDAALQDFEEAAALINFWCDLRVYRKHAEWDAERAAERLAALEKEVLNAYAEHVLAVDYFGQLTSEEAARSFAVKLLAMPSVNLAGLHESANETVQNLIRYTPDFPPRGPSLRPLYPPPSLPANHPRKKYEKFMLRMEDIPDFPRRSLPKPLD